MGALATLLPIAFGLVAGFTLRRLKLVGQPDGEGLFKLVFFVFVPAVTFNSLSTVDLEPRLALYPAAAVVIIAASYVSARFTAARAGFDPVQTAVVVSGGMVVNTAFQLPFAQLLYGADGVARIAAFDIVNTTATFTLSYLVAIRGNPSHPGGPVRLDRLAKNPALYAIVAGLLVNAAGITVPAPVAGAIATVGSATAVVIPIGIGILFNPIGRGLGKAVIMVAARLATGLIVAAAIVVLLGLSGMDRTVLLLIGAAPLVFAVVTFASLEDLDVTLATTAVSLSLLVSVILSVLIVVATV